MSDTGKPILVFGATGQQGGSVAAALLQTGWPVRAFVRDPSSQSSLALAEAGATLVKGDLADIASIDEAMEGAYGVFSVQPASPGGVITDADEVHYGTSIADLAMKHGVSHLVYSSTNAARDEPSGMGHFDSKAAIEKHIRSLPITATIVRPAAFMEMLLMPGFGLPDKQFNFFVRPDQAIQFLAVEDIGRIVAPIFQDPGQFGGKTIEIASDAVTGSELEAAFCEAAGFPIKYARFPDALLAENPFLQGLTRLVDNGQLAGQADLDWLRTINPELYSFRTWLNSSGKKAFVEALGTAGAWSYNQ